MTTVFRFVNHQPRGGHSVNGPSRCAAAGGSAATQGRTQDFGKGVCCSNEGYRAQSVRRNFSKPRPLISENPALDASYIYETSDMQGHGLGRATEPWLDWDAGNESKRR